MPIFNLLFYLVFRSKRNFYVKKIDRLGSLEDEENKSSRGKLGDISETDPFQNLQLIDFKYLSSEEISCKKTDSLSSLEHDENESSPGRTWRYL